MQAPSCAICRHFDLEATGEQQKGICPAFPDGIPNRIMLGYELHHEPYPGDHGIQFEPRADLVHLYPAKQEPARTAA